MYPIHIPTLSVATHGHKYLVHINSNIDIMACRVYDLSLATNNTLETPRFFSSTDHTLGPVVEIPRGEPVQPLDLGNN